MLLIFTFSTEQERDRFEHIFHKYKNLMMHKAYGILGDYMLAEDAASEAFIRVYKNMHKIGDPDSPRTAAFVVTIVRNVALTMRSREKSRASEELTEFLSDDFDLEESILSQLSSEGIFSMLGSGLSEEHRSVFLLKYAYEMSHSEIGETLGISENNVTVILHRARKKIAQLLREEGYVNG